MKKLLIPALCLCVSLSLAACSTPEEPAEEESGGRVEEFNHTVARDATNAIKRPLDKARNVQERSRQREQDMPQE